MLVPVSCPYIGESEVQYVNQALKANALSGLFGDFIGRFETQFADFCDTKYAVSCSSGTAALHLAMLAAGIKSGDEILVSTLTNMATFFSVLYLGAKPVPVDIDPVTLTMDPEDLARKITKNSKGIMVVHLFGHPTDMDPISELADRHGLLVFEDCAEAHGALYKGKKVGGLSSAGAFSFFANKVLTTGEGGMVTTNDFKVAEKAKSLRSLSFGKHNKFMHDDIGFNYRMSNLQAAIGCGQMEAADQLVGKRREIASSYSKLLSHLTDCLALPQEMSWATSVYWMYHIVLKGDLSLKRQQVLEQLKMLGVETREGFVPYNLQKIFLERGWVKEDECPNANKVAYASFYLPSGPNISDDELSFVASSLTTVINHFS
jgi:perosamine synthetase